MIDESQEAQLASILGVAKGESLQHAAVCLEADRNHWRLLAKRQAQLERELEECRDLLAAREDERLKDAVERLLAVQKALACNDIVACQKCGAPRAQSTKLIGGFHALLCLSCVNTWDEFIRGEARFLEFEEKLSLQRLAESTGSVDLVQRVREVLDLDFVLFRVGKEWVKKR